MYDAVYGAIYNAEGALTTVLGAFVDIFAPPSTESGAWFITLLNVLGLVFSVATVPIFDECKSFLLAPLCLVKSTKLIPRLRLNPLLCSSDKSFDLCSV